VNKALVSLTVRYPHGARSLPMQLSGSFGDLLRLGTHLPCPPFGPSARISFALTLGSELRQILLRVL
jgi:hypothetical protein